MPASEPTLNLQINGQPRTLALSIPTTLTAVLTALSIQSDRVAVELNGTIISRTAWPTTHVPDASRLEIVHFVGGGKPQGKTA